MSSPVSTYIALLLDRSSSMSHQRKTVVAGVNEFLDAQRLVNAPCHVQIIAFSEPGDYETIASGDVQHISNFTEDTYNPMGFSTAFYDAAVKAIDEVGMTLFKMPEASRPKHVLFYMVTDGENNAFTEMSDSSYYYNGYNSGGILGHRGHHHLNVTQRINALKERIKHQSAKYNWKFLYLGTNQDAVMAASVFGLNSDSSLGYNNTTSGTKGAFAMASEKAVSYRSGNFDALKVTVNDRDTLNKA